MVLPFFGQAQYKHKPLILSSVGRWVGEEQSVVEALKATDHELKAVVLLQLEESMVHERWENAKKLGDRGRRADDTKGTVLVRLIEFKDKTVPVIEQYRQRGLLIEVDGTLPPDNVSGLIIEALYKQAVDSK